MDCVQSRGLIPGTLRSYLSWWGSFFYSSKQGHGVAHGSDLWPEASPLFPRSSYETEAWHRPCFHIPAFPLTETPDQVTQHVCKHTPLPAAILYLDTLQAHASEIIGNMHGQGAGVRGGGGESYLFPTSLYLFLFTFFKKKSDYFCISHAVTYFEQQCCKIIWFILNIRGRHFRVLIFAFKKLCCVCFLPCSLTGSILYPYFLPLWSQDSLF